MPNSISVIGATALVLTGALLAGGAHAADLDPPYDGSSSYPEDKVEFGSGWYIRGDLGASQLPKITNTNAVLNACADGIDRARQPRRV